MKKSFFFSILLSLTLSSQLWAAAWDQSLELDDNNDRAEAFLKIRNLIPSLGEGAINYGMDPVTLFLNQQKIQTMMSSNSEYSRLRPAHGELLQFQVLDGKPGEGENPEKVQNWNLWVERARQIAHSRGLSNENAVANEILKAMESPLLGKSQGIVVGLAQLLPGSLRKDFFAAAPDLKVKILQEHLPAEVVSQGFAPARIGWADTSISKEEIISRLQGALQVEQMLTVLMVDHYVSVQNRLSSIKDYASSWKVDAGVKKSLDQWFNSSVAKLIPQEKAATITMTLREVSPVVGLFRGFAGNDCATKFSAPFVNSPNEYTFIIYDNKGAVKGYAQGTKLVAEGKNAFYLHTITGPRLSKKDAHEIISLFNQQKARFGAVEVLLPSADKIKELINFLPVREAIIEVVADSSKKLTYQDAEIRKDFKETFSIGRNYDDPEGNLKAQVLRSGNLVPVQVVVGEAAGLENVSTAIDKNVLLGVLMQLRRKNQKENDAMLKALLPYADVTLGTVAEFVRRSKNPDELEIKEFLRQFQQYLEKEGFSLTEDYLLKNTGLVAEGLTKSPDLRHNQKVFKLVTDSLLERNEGYILADLLLKDAEPLMNKDYATKFFKSYYNDMHDADSTKGASLVEKILIKNPSMIFSSTEVFSAVVRSKTVRNKMHEFLRAYPKWASTLNGRPEAQVLLRERQEYNLTVQETIQKLHGTKTEADYRKVLVFIEKRMSSDAEGRDLARNLLALTVDHYISLKPNETLDYAMNLLYKSETHRRALRRLIPQFMRASSIRDVNLYIASFIDLKEKGVEGIPQALFEALSRRPGIESMDLNELIALKRLPEINWNGLKGLRCEMLF